jgi:5-methyltetrahydrofolate--homocysteine methyltransferase
MEKLIKKVKDAVIEMNLNEVNDNIQAALQAGANADQIMNDGLIAAMDVVGKKFASGEIYVPEMLVSAMVMKTGLKVIKDHFKTKPYSGRGKIIMGTVKGDLHDIGKNIVVMMLEGAGFEVVDLGVDLSPEKIADTVAEGKAQVLGLSALLTTTLPQMQIVIDMLAQRGLRDKVKVMVGGAPVNENFAQSIGADGYGKDAAAAVALARKMVS